MVVRRAIAQTILLDFDDDDTDCSCLDDNNKYKYQDWTAMEILHWSGIWEGPICFETRQCTIMTTQQGIQCGLGQGRVEIWNIDKCWPRQTRTSFQFWVFWFLVSNICFPLQEEVGHSAQMCWRQSERSPMCSGLLSRFDLSFQHRSHILLLEFPCSTFVH